MTVQVWIIGCSIRVTSNTVISRNVIFKKKKWCVTDIIRESFLAKIKNISSEESIKDSNDAEFTNNEYFLPKRNIMQPARLNDYYT